MESIRFLRTSCLSTLAAFGLATSVFAVEDDVPTSIQLSRYSSLSVAPETARRNIMVSVIDERLSDDVETVGDAVDYLVSKYGYSVGRASSEDESQYYLFRLPLPNTHREFSPFPLISALALLGGEGFGVVVNPVRREVTYRLEDAYRGSLTEKEIQDAKAQWLARHPSIALSDTKASTSCDEVRLDSYGPVVAGDSLLTISRSLDRAGLTDAQVMISIFDHNPSSFLHNNINYLLEGTHLNIPSKAVMQAMPRDFAKQRVWAQYRAWKAKKSK